MATPKYPDNLQPGEAMLRGDKYHVLYAALLRIAHNKGLKSLRTKIEQFPNEENGFTCITSSIAIMKDGETFEDVGDASANAFGTGKANVGSNIVPHLVRMSSTRSKARALRDATNIGVAAYEEFSGDEGGDNLDPDIISIISQANLEDLTSMFKSLEDSDKHLYKPYCTRRKIILEAASKGKK